VRSVWEFFAIAVVVTIMPGPATATILRVAARDGRRAATQAILGNSAGVLSWGALSAVGVSSLILASHIAYDALRIGGAAVLVALGLRSLLGGLTEPVRQDPGRARPPAGWRAGLLTSIANPKLAAFFVALFPQFLSPGAPVLPYALAMAGAIVLFDLIWYSTLAFTVDRASMILRPHFQRRLERITGAVMVGFGVKLATGAR
jgi:threonine/homoserine/homoserine lactone efflux protein